MDHGARIIGNEVRILDYGVWVFDRGPRPKGQNAQSLSKLLKKCAKKAS